MISTPIFRPLRVILTSVLLLADPALAAWVWEDPLPQGARLLSAVAKPDLSTFVAVGAHGAAVVRTTNGPWRALPSISNGKTLSSAIWSGNSFLATGPGAGLWESSDGLEWALRDGSVDASRLFVIGGRIVCIGRESVWSGLPPENRVLRSLTGIGLGAVLADAVISGGRILAVDSTGKAVTTLDGLAWTPASLPSLTSIFLLQGGPEGFLAAGRSALGQPVLRTSSDGESWKELAPPVGASPDFRVFPAAQGWIFLDLQKNRFHRSNATSWDVIELPAGASPIPYSATILSTSSTLLVGERGLVAVLESGQPMTIESASAIPSNLLYAPRFAAVGLGNFAAAIDKNVSRAAEVRLYTSSNPNAWHMPSPAPVEGLTTLSVVNNRIVGYSLGTSATPPGFYGLFEGGWKNMGNASVTDTPFEGEVVSIAANPAQSPVLALVREQTYDLDLSYSAKRDLYSSSNWIDWTPVSLPALRDLQPPTEDNPETLFWDGSRFVLLLHPGRIFLSSNGLDWSQVPSLPADSKEKLAADFPGRPVPAANHAVSVASDGTRLVARTAKLAPGGSLLGEIPRNLETFFVFDNNRWWPVAVAPHVDPSKRLVLWNGSRFHAIGTAGILASTDGFQWTSQPVPDDLASLVWTGSRFLGFTDSFAILSHEGELPEGAPVGLPPVSPRTKTLDPAAQNYQIQTPSTGSPVTLSGAPLWISTTPSPDHSLLTVSVSENTGPNSRGAILVIGGQPHLVSQLGSRPLAPLRARPGLASLSIPFSGDWSASASSALVAFAKNATTGKGNLRLSIPANPAPTERTFTVNLNGMDFTIQQAGQSPDALRAGTYSGLAGWLAQASSPSSADSFESLDGRIDITVASPSPSSPHGSYSASLSVFDGNRTLRFTGKGALGADGSLSSQWKSSTKGVPAAEVSLTLTDDHANNRFFSGNISAASISYGVLAGKNIFHSKTNPLSAPEAGQATAFLTSFPTLDSVVDIGVASAKILPSGIVRWTGTLANGSKLSASSFVWGACGPSLALPFSFTLPSASGLVSGLATRTAASPSHDWSGGTTTWLVKGATPFYGWSHLSAYTPPSRSRPALDWTAPAAFSLAAENLAGTDGDILFTKPASLRASLPGGSVSLKITPATGLVTGSFSLPGSKKPSALLFGAVNQKYRDTSTGSILGFAAGLAKGQFSAFPK